MKKIFFLFSLLAIGLSSLAQLRVANNFGQDLNVSIAGKEQLVPSKSVKTFTNVRVKTVWLDCRTTDGAIKFSVSKDVSRAGLVEIVPSDNVVNVPTVTKTTIISGVTTVTNNEVVQNSGPSLSDILKGNVTVVSDNSYSVPSSSSYTSSTVNQPVITQSVVTTSRTVSTEAITLVYLGSRNLKIISSEGQGFELMSVTDSLKPEYKNKFIIYAQKNADLVIGVGHKKQAQQAIWPYGEIRKRVNTEDQIVRITDNDIKMMSSPDVTNKVKFRLDAPDYKSLIETDDGSIISLGYKDASQSVELPIGQSYIRISYTDPQGEFHPTAFMPVHVTPRDRWIPITTKSLSKTLTIKNF